MVEKQNKRLFLSRMMSKFIPSEGIQDRFGLWTPRCGFRISGTEFRYLYKKELGFWGLFLERPGNFSGPKAHLKIKTC